MREIERRQHSCDCSGVSLLEMRSRDTKSTEALLMDTVGTFRHTYGYVGHVFRTLVWDTLLRDMYLAQLCGLHYRGICV